MLPDPAAERVYLLDAHGLLFQMFHGIPSMSAPDGRPVNAVFGVSRSLMNLYDHGAAYLLAVFDHKDPTFRDKISPDYKAHRDPPPEELLQQEPLIHKVLEAMRIPLLCLPGFEADDLMATVAKAAADRGHDVFLCTSDKDCRQCLSDRVKILNLRKGEELNADGLMKDWGVRPEQVIDFQSLVGDSVDNVPGVPGVGPKTATKWLQQYGTLDNLIAHADEVGGPKVKASLQAAIADGTLAQCKELVTLRTDVPMPLDWDGWRRRDWDGQQLLELFQEFGFRGFAGKVRSTLTQSGAKANNDLLASIGEAPANVRRGSSPPKGKAAVSLFDQIDENSDPAADFAFGANAATDSWDYTGYKLIDEKPKFDKFLKELKKQPRFVFDLETTSLDPLTAEVVGIAICWKAGESHYLAVRGPAGSKLLDADATLAALKPIFENPKVGKLNQNIKYDLLVLRSHGIELAGIAGDPMLAHYLLNAGERTHNLDELTRRYLSHENISITELIGKGKNQIGMADVPVEKVMKYAAEDADTALRLADLFEPQLEPKGLESLYRDLELALVPVLAELEFNGFLLDLPFLAKLSGEMATQLAAMETEIHALAGSPVNIASPAQLRELLFEKMKLPVQKRTDKTGEPSTDQESLEKLAAMGHELPRRIIDHRQVAKLKGTYVDALPALVNSKTGRVHTSFNQTIAATGRLSSSDPNLQNIPTRTEQGKQIRQAFVAPPGYVILTADYSQIELRLLAHFCQDAAMLATFAADKDVHASVAAEVFKVPEAEVTSAQRRVAKMVNFGVIYGISAHGLSTRLGITRAEGEKFIEEYFARFPTVLAYQDGVIAKARETGYVGTILGRRRPFDPSALRPNSSYQQRTGAEREAINMEIQGSAADLMKQAMLGVYRRLNAEKSLAKMLLTVHDELVFEVPTADVTATAALVCEEMSGAMTLTVPLKVDVAAGRNWLDVEDVA